MSFDPTKPVKFANRPDVDRVEILATDLTGDYPILSKYRTGSGVFSIRHKRNGEPESGSAWPSNDHVLINIPPEPKWRAWKPEDIGPNWSVSRKGIFQSGWTKILYVCESSIIIVSSYKEGREVDPYLLEISYQELFEHWNCQKNSDGIKTPCGILETPTNS